MTDFLLFYLGVGYAINNIFALLVLYQTDGETEVDFANFIYTIPAWPYTLYQIICAYFSKE